MDSTGLQTGLQCSKMLLTSVKYKVLLRLGFVTKWQVLLVNPKICDALLSINCWCSCHVNSLLTVTPKSFSPIS